MESRAYRRMENSTRISVERDQYGGVPCVKQGYFICTWSEVKSERT